MNCLTGNFRLDPNHDHYHGLGKSNCGACEREADARQRTRLAVGELVQAAVHSHGGIGPVEYDVLQNRPHRPPIVYGFHKCTTQGDTPMNEQKLFTPAQMEIVRDLCETHGLVPEQISFNESETTPFFDHEATSLLALRLTDIQHLDCRIANREYDGQNDVPRLWHRTTARCTVTLPDGRTRTVEDTAVIGEILGNGVVVEDERLGEATAKNRAVRLAVRSVGVNLWNAHKQFKATGEVATGSTAVNPRQTLYNEIHALAEEIDLIVGGDRTEYERFLGEMFPGITSSRDLNDIEIRQFRAALRQMRHVKQLSGPRHAA